MNFKLITIFILFSIIVDAKEISMFGAGDISSSNPYGLDKNEKAIYKNKKDLEKIIYKYNKLKNNFDELNEQLEGFNSVYESDSKNLNKTRKSLLGFHSSIQLNNSNIENLQHVSKINSDSIISLEKRIDSFILLQNENNKNVENSLKRITYLLNKINKNYTHKNEFNELVNFVNSKKKKSKVAVKKISNKDKLKKAINMVNKRYLTKSIPLWNDLLYSGYKPSVVNFYFGEVRYGKKQYKKAISHYKKSMMLNDEADYIAKLLLHSAISFERINDRENAINFYNTIVDAYENTPEAKVAKNKLNKLN